MGAEKYFNAVVRKDGRRGWVVGYGDNDNSNFVQVGWDADPVTDAEVEDEWIALDELEVDYKESWEFQIERAEKLEMEVQKARIEAQICKECFKDLQDLCVALAHQVVPYVQAFQPLKSKMGSSEEMKAEIAKRLKGVAKERRQKKKKG